MKLKSDKNNDVIVITAEGSLDISVQPQFKNDLQLLIGNTKEDVVMDLSSVTFIDSSCLGVLVSLAKELRENKGDICLASLCDEVRSIFQITRLDRVFEIHDSVSEAIDSYFV